ncbi:CDP-glucose 4,6-dehydratase [Candidatus Parcubacteria bacterium]|nr:CDP-glucose 4,6-dehydratase [Candidatus Parcubacteria bacterium]
MKGLFNNVYKGKKILITGHTGFKGSWLALWLTKLGAEVIGYSKNTPTTPSHFELLKLPIKSITGDVLDKKKLLSTIKKYKPDIIFHMAAQPIVRLSYVDPVNTFETNIMGVVNILESARKVGNIKAIVNITSDKCYRNTGKAQSYIETDPMGGNDPYSASKGAAELVSHAFRHSYFNPDDYGKKHTTLIANVRAGNVIGGGDWAADRLIPDLMKAASKGRTVTIRFPRATRPWQHVLEALSGYLHIGSKLLQGHKEFADNWNFGPTNEHAIPVYKVIEHAKTHWDSFMYEIKEDPHAFHEDRFLMLDSKKARTKLKWKSIWNSHKTFERTVTWYNKFYVQKELVTEQDLEEYINNAKRARVAWATQ